MKVNAAFLVILIIVCTAFTSSAEKDIFTDQFVLHHSGGPDEVRRYAQEHGFVYLDRVCCYCCRSGHWLMTALQIFGDHYHLRHHSVSKRSLEPHPHHHIQKMVANQSQVSAESCVKKKRLTN